MTEYQRLLDALVKKGSFTTDLLGAKRATLDESVRQIGVTRSLVKVLGLSESDIADAITTAFRLPLMVIANEMDTAPPNIFAEDEILEYRALPVFHSGLELTVAFIDPPEQSVRVHLQKLCGFRVIPVITTISDFDAALKKYTGALDKLQRIGSLINLEKYDTRKGGSSPSVSQTETDATMAQLADEVLLRAAKSAASDIHIEPARDEMMVRFRVDGFLQRVVSLPKSYHSGIVSVLKAKSGMDMFERTVPQDGRMTLTFADRVIDVRVNTLPLLHGEKMVLRLLGKTAMIANLDSIGFSERNLELFRSLLALPNGIVLVTGPTGSGKTTTLYAGLNEVKSIGRNITTVENPVEYELDLINQVQVVSERGLTFASVLRAILRQDPNVVLIGEIRDAETGIIATEAALTGHLVLSTLHTNDAVGAIPRMINLGVESFWVSSSVIGVLAQRLVRKICSRCKEEYEPDAKTLAVCGLSRLPKGVTFYRGRGCNYCSGLGYKGRVAIHEVLSITEEMRDVIYGEVTTSKIRALAAANGFRDMYFDGMQKAFAGITTIDEIRRVTKKTV
jgi:type IV pilus assembly protein PilB